MTETVIVSGACGFVGCLLVNALIREGRDVAVITRNSKRVSETFSSDERNEILVLTADLTDYDSLADISEKVEYPCYLIHLGGYILGSSEQAKEYDAQRAIDTNISGSYNLIKLLKPKLTGACLASTLDVYGNPQSLPIRESHPVMPKTFYAVSKLAMELYALSELQGKLPLSILRFSHIYGPGDPHRKVLQMFIDSVQRGEDPVIYGDGSDLRDYIYVEDVIKVILRVMELRSDGVLNVASGKKVTLKEIAEKAVRISGKNLTPVYKERILSRNNMFFDISRLKKVLSFTPEISIKQGISNMLDENVGVTKR